MDRKEYIEKRRELENQIAKIKTEYLKSNSIYPIGTKLKVNGKDSGSQYGIVKGYEITPLDDVFPILAAIKKDGTAHPRNTIYIWRGSTFEVCND